MAKKKRDYTAVLAKVPQHPLVPPERRDVVDHVKRQILGSTPEDVDPEVTTEDFLLTLDSYLKTLYRHAVTAPGGDTRGTTYARLYAELRGIQDKMSEWASQMELILDAYTELMVATFEAEQVSAVRLQNGQLVSTWREPYAQVKNKEAFRLWCVAQGLEAKMALPWATTNELVKDLVAAGEPEPDGVEVFGKVKIRLGGSDTD